MNFAEHTINLAKENVRNGGRPFACTHDPTARAEILAVRAACMKLQTEHLTDCEIYVLASPCPMCLGSLYYCSPKKVIYLTTREEYSAYYTDNRKYFELETSYDEYSKLIGERRLPMVKEPRKEALEVYAL
ncbi:hypothetical protein K7432_011219 [Basidiobolus ranarum]|uniref:CMP/dCMP-type deaminase domain-containing protein n=1 Tax=Basidiobolus ranarum TaxID=34480 RepID=A0ABR2VV78_9FUNG